MKIDDAKLLSMIIQASELTEDDIATIRDYVENGKVMNVQFIGGCNGNLQGIGKLVEGMDIDDVIARVEGVTCGMKKTSCPDQLAQALIAAKNA